MAQTKKTDNSYLSDKVALRAAHLPELDVVRVMDCYSGEGKIWRAVATITGRKIVSLPIDIRDDIGFHLPGTNLGYLSSMDLSKFDVIDLDAYGTPYDQIKMIFERGYHGVVFVTFIQSVMGGISSGILREIGFTDAMIRKIPTLFYKQGWDHFLQFLAVRGVQRIHHRSHSRKHYLCFAI